MSSYTATQHGLIGTFRHLLEQCAQSFRGGAKALDLPCNIEGVFGPLAAKYFMRHAGDIQGKQVSITYDTDRAVTLVQLEHEPEPQSGAEPIGRAAGVGPPAGRRPPRPMNCWMMFRDAMHKQFKDMNPDLSVQQISTLCSREWKVLPAAEKDRYRAMAKHAKEEHQRRFPDYKYNPRRPGEKKKRQSRKATPGTATFTAPAEVFDFNSFPEAVAVPTDSVHDAESLRHDRLHHKISPIAPASFFPQPRHQPQNLTTSITLCTSHLTNVSQQQPANMTSPNADHVASYLAACTGEEMVRLLAGTADPAAQAALTTAVLLGPAPKPLKALNAFVAFRCYLIKAPGLAQIPMKMLSNPMGVLWEADPNKPLWSLMAKAWSTMRDQVGKRRAPLDEFLRLICPHLKIPAPEMYLECLGWKLVINGEGAPTVSREFTPDPNSEDAEDAEAAANGLSVGDIINYVRSTGYAQGYSTDKNTASSTFLSRVRDGRVAKRQAKPSHIQQLDKDIAALHAVSVPEPEDSNGAAYSSMFPFGLAGPFVPGADHDATLLPMMRKADMECGWMR
ncbi:mating-type protein MAT alpha 1-domain-containing protein [Massariosphaeria phaeospora]|uniref:Mating-type protein MAT-1 n=1 Tax=Massariosphaeria phaeospora TaxID=100035 RepID=A0A7C8M978_9PLEO|nr:mating-type protein MAT alpha 1-domain-containing protein [Massariosphaeria phaeospora]